MALARGRSAALISSLLKSGECKSACQFLKDLGLNLPNRSCAPLGSVSSFSLLPGGAQNAQDQRPAAQLPLLTHWQPLQLQQVSHPAQLLCCILGGATANLSCTAGVCVQAAFYSSRTSESGDGPFAKPAWPSSKREVCYLQKYLASS